MSDTTAEPTAEVADRVDDDDATTGVEEAAAPDEAGAETESAETTVVSADYDAAALPRRTKGKRANRRRRQQAAARRAAAADSADSAKDTADEAKADDATADGEPSPTTEPETGESASDPDHETAKADTDTKTADDTDSGPDDGDESRSADGSRVADGVFDGAAEADQASSDGAEPPKADTTTNEGRVPGDGEDLATMRAMFGDEDGGVSTPSLRKWDLDLELAPRGGTTHVSEAQADDDADADQDRAPRSGGRSPRPESGVGEPGALIRMADGAVNAFRSVVVLWLPVLLLIAVVAWSVTAFIMS